MNEIVRKTAVPKSNNGDKNDFSLFWYWIVLSLIYFFKAFIGIAYFNRNQKLVLMS